MTMAGVNRAPHPSSLADVLDVVLDKGIVIDAYVRVAVVGIELLTIDARIVIASVDTYLRFAEAVDRLVLEPSEKGEGLPGLIQDMQSGGAKAKTRGAIQGAKEKAQDVVQSIKGRDDEDEDENEDRGQRRQGRGVPAERRAPERG
jgi:gas vesicle structural protein